MIDRASSGSPPGASSDGPSTGLRKRVVEHYEEALREHGATARGMDWKDEASQRLRFEVLSEIAPLAGRSVCEIGCGAGHLYDFLKETDPDVSYRGIDLSAAMVDAARARHPELRFDCVDILNPTKAPGASHRAPSNAPWAERADFVLCSGLFHVRLEHEDAEWQAFIDAMLTKMFAMCSQGMAFNLMSDRVDFRAPALYYKDPEETLSFCRQKLGARVTLRHDYPLHEYTVYAYRDSESVDVE